MTKILTKHNHIFQPSAYISFYEIFFMKTTMATTTKGKEGKREREKAGKKYGMEQVGQNHVQ